MIAACGTCRATAAHDRTLHGYWVSSSSESLAAAADEYETFTGTPELAVFLAEVAGCIRAEITHRTQSTGATPS